MSENKTFMFEENLNDLKFRQMEVYLRSFHKAVAENLQALDVEKIAYNEAQEHLRGQLVCLALRRIFSQEQSHYTAILKEAELLGASQLNICQEVIGLVERGQREYNNYQNAQSQAESAKNLVSVFESLFGKVKFADVNPGLQTLFFRRGVTESQLFGSEEYQFILKKYESIRRENIQLKERLQEQQQQHCYFTLKKELLQIVQNLAEAQDQFNRMIESAKAEFRQNAMKQDNHSLQNAYLKDIISVLEPGETQVTTDQIDAAKSILRQFPQVLNLAESLKLQVESLKKEKEELKKQNGELESQLQNKVATVSDEQSPKKCFKCVELEEQVRNLEQTVALKGKANDELARRVVLLKKKVKDLSKKQPETIQIEIEPPKIDVVVDEGKAQKGDISIQKQKKQKKR